MSKKKDEQIKKLCLENDQLRIKIKHLESRLKKEDKND